ncbi:MAG: glycosyltransferase family 87 protein [Segetibacter sp.]
MTPFYQKITLKHVIVLIILLALGITIQGIIASRGDIYTHYNNLVIFKSSFGHLIHNQNLYLYYPKEYFDLYKYSPAFSVLMAPFYYLQNEVGLFLFNIINTTVFIYAILKLKLNHDSLKFLFLFLFLEFGISMQWVQTNVLIASLIVFSFYSLENKRPLLASLLIVLTVYIKIFGLVAVVLAVFYPGKIRFILYTIMWAILFAILPLLIISKNELLQQYQNWINLLKWDHEASYGVSFIGLVHSWFNLNFSKIGTVAIAAIIFCIPLLKFICYKSYQFRLQILASLLIWIVIFNHRGESPTYIISLFGVGIWYFSQPPNIVNKILLWLCLIFTSFTSTDLITPGWITEKYVDTYSIKAVFSIIIWIKLIVDLMTKKHFKCIGGDEAENKELVPSLV